MTLKVLGAGLGRTGTVSLTFALERLGFGPCLHNTTPTLAPLWIEAIQGRLDWNKLFAGYNSVTDYPACNFWRELATYYPHLKIVVTVRDPDDWFRSTQETIFSEEALRQFSLSPARELFEVGVWRGIKENIHSKDFMIAHYRKHTLDIQEAIPPDRLLVCQAADGWDPLCEFLQVPVPDEPFPHANTSDDTKALLSRLWGLFASVRG